MIEKKRCDSLQHLHFDLCFGEGGCRVCHMHLCQLRSPRGGRLDGFYFCLSFRRVYFWARKSQEKLDTQIHSTHRGKTTRPSQQATRNPEGGTRSKLTRSKLTRRPALGRRQNKPKRQGASKATNKNLLASQRNAKLTQKTNSRQSGAHWKVRICVSNFS